MGLSLGAKVCVLFVTASLLAVLSVCEAKTIVVGGSEGWHYGFNYTDWALQNSPFYFNDKLGQYSLYIYKHLIISPIF